MYKATVAFILVAINFIIQSSIAPNLAMGHVMINFIIILVVSVALIRGRVSGAIIGFMSGLMIDIFFGQAIGFYSLVYMYIGFVTGNFNRGFYKESVLIPMIIVGMADVSYNFVIYFFTYFVRGRWDLKFYLGKFVFPEAIMTAFVSIIAYRIYLLINEKFEKRQKKREETFEQL